MQHTIVPAPQGPSAPTCRSCAGALLPPGLSLGDQPLVDAATNSPEAARAAPRHPLAVTLCPICGLAQLADPPDPLQLSGGVQGRPSYSQMVAESARKGRERPDQRGMPGNDLVVSILGQVWDPNEVVSVIATLLADDEPAVLEFPYLRDLVDRDEFATVRHGRASYFSMTSLVELLARHGLAATGVERCPLDGGALRVRVQRRTGRGPQAPVAALLREEEELGVADPGYLAAFGGRVAALMDDLLALLASLRTEGALVAGYGAAAEATTLLNMMGAGPDEVAFVADHRHDQQGRFIPGAAIPIVSPQEMLDGRPDVLVVFAWSAAEEVFERHHALREAGTRFVVPAPEVRIL